MISQQLLDQLHNLPRSDKLRIIQILAGDLAAEDEDYFMPGASYEIWSPYDAPQAADALTKMLEADKAANG